MSNPGVLSLAQAEIGKQLFRIEDNIGESIHVHFGSIRIDFSVLEFINLVDSLIVTMEKMINIENFFFHSFDAIWLSQVSSLILELREIEFIKKRVGEMLTNQYDEYGQYIVSIKDARASKAIHGDKSELEQWEQINYIFDTNTSRMRNIYNSIKECGYHPEGNGSYIIICDNGNFVADGCHRVSAIYDLYGNIEISVANWITENRICSDENRREQFKQEREGNIKKIRQEIRQKKNKKILKKIQVDYLVDRDLRGKKIIIKGAGEHSKQFLSLYADKINVVGILAENILDESLKGFPRILEKDLKKVNADIIFISSYKYYQEMKEEMKKYEYWFEVYSLYDKGIEEEFFS